VILAHFIAADGMRERVRMSHGIVDTAIIDMGRIFHTGIRVPSVDDAMRELGATLGHTWATVQHSVNRAVWTPQHGLQHVELTFTYSAEGPVHLELLESPAGSPWHHGGQPGIHHLGVWSDDVPGDTERCIAAGWSIVAAATSPDDGYGSFTYVAPPSGLIVELVTVAALPRFDAWWAGGMLGTERLTT
jgi:catechol 2,3-dioxygenase-like lactoylglutathione lyase family enzyme